MGVQDDNLLRHFVTPPLGQEEDSSLFIKKLFKFLPKILFNVSSI